MKIRVGKILIVILTAGMILSSCAISARMGTDLMAGVEAAQWPDNPQAASPDFVEALHNFSWKLADAMDKKDGNRMISPASVYLALAMTMNGADGQTRTDMIKALASEKLTMEQINQAARDWMILLSQTDGKNKLRIVNSIWYREEFAAAKPFLQSNADFYKAAAQSLDFTDSKSVDTINSWVKKATEGTIKEMIDSIDSDTAMFLINAIYFKAEWLTKFAYEDTADGSFKSPDGPVNVRFMSRTGSMDYIKTQDAEGVLLPYSDQKFAFVALLPNENKTPQDLIHSLDAAAMNQMIDQRQTKNVALQLPKFQAEFETKLKGPLSTLGMGIAFDAGSADFSLMQENKKKNLYIDNVTHKTFIRVDELGTEAAAVTKVEMKLTSAPVTEIALSFNRPFLYCIIDLRTNLPLFIGVVEKPQS